MRCRKTDRYKQPCGLPVAGALPQAGAILGRLLMKRTNVFVLLGTWLLILTACGSSDDDAFTEGGALAVSDAYIEAFNSGDANAVVALFTPDVALSEKLTGMSESFEAIDRAFFEQHLAWSTAQGTTFTSPECAVTDGGGGAEVTVACEFGWLYAAEKAFGAPPVPTVLTMVVTADGINGLAFEYPPEFGLVRFDTWLFLKHKDDSQGVEFGDWNSVADAEAGGTLRAQYVAEWAASLTANN